MVFLLVFNVAHPGMGMLAGQIQPSWAPRDPVTRCMSAHGPPGTGPRSHALARGREVEPGPLPQSTVDGQPQGYYTLSRDILGTQGWATGLSPMSHPFNTLVLLAWDPLDTTRYIPPPTLRPPLGWRAAAVAEWVGTGKLRGALDDREQRSEQLRAPPGKLGGRRRWDCM